MPPRLLEVGILLDTVVAQAGIVNLSSRRHPILIVLGRVPRLWRVQLEIQEGQVHSMELLITLLAGKGVIIPTAGRVARP